MPSLLPLDLYHGWGSSHWLSDRILVELFQILKDDAVESAALNMQYAGSWHSTLQDPMDCNLPGFSIHGIFQARVLEGGAIAFSREVPYDFLNNIFFCLAYFIVKNTVYNS